MFFYEGLSCPHCDKAFVANDDIVACPECGAPHHRECWEEQGHCAVESLHGTPEQWSRDRALRERQDQTHDTTPCAHCGAPNSPFAEFCSHCGRPIEARDWNTNERTAPRGAYTEYAPFHHVQQPCGGVKPNTVIEGETALDLAVTVRTNTPYYIPRFERIATSGKKLTWNWAAFLIPSYWLLFRKQYLWGALMMLCELVYVVFNNVIIYTQFSSALVKNAMGGVSFDPQALFSLLESDHRAFVAGALLSMMMITMLLIRLCVALYANRLYMKWCLRTISKVRQDYPESYLTQLSMLGGTSFALAAIGYMGMQLLPELIIMTLL